MNSELLQSVITDLEQREARGKAKYNTTMDRADLSHEEWLQHAYEEALDMALYLKKAINSKSYPHDKVMGALRTAINTSVEGTIRWIEDQTDIVDITSKEIISNAEITPKEKHIELHNHITKCLAENGINVISKDNPNSMSDKSNINPNSAQ